eukprot:gene11343-18964_t
MSNSPTASVAAHAGRRFGMTGQKCLVTGGTKGLGAAIVEEFSALGAEVYTCARSQTDLDEKLRFWRARGFSVQVHGFSVQGAWVLSPVNNVGTNVRKPTTDYTIEDYKKVMSANLDSAFQLCQLAHPLLKASGNASVLFNSSVAGGPLAMGSGAVYGITKTDKSPTIRDAKRGTAKAPPKPQNPNQS